MKQNSEGFLFPKVNEDLCIKCGKCERACPYLNAGREPDAFSVDDFVGKKAYVFFDESEDRIDSSSGGFVFALGKKIISEGGLVCGCAWNENLVATHICAETVDQLKGMQSSKYVQSQLGECFLQIKDALKKNRTVLFGGTPCQTAALHSFLGGKDYENLISVCVICHGVPSPLVWEKYKTCLEKKYNAKLVDVNMRDKTYKGYAESYCKYVFESGKDSKQKELGWPTYLSDPYVFLFTDNLFLRRSCSHCKYKSSENHADIIVGDFHASIKEAGSLGCSSVIAMTDKGLKYISLMDGFKKDIDVSVVGNSNTMLWKSVPEHKNRHVFFERMAHNENVNMRLFTDFLPVRFKVKKIMNQLGIFKYWRSIKLKKKG